MQDNQITATGPCVIAELVDLSTGTVRRMVYDSFAEADSFGRFTSKYTVLAGRSEQVTKSEKFDVDAYLDALHADEYQGRD